MPLSAFVGLNAVKAPTVQLGGRLQAARLELLPLLATPWAARQLLQVVAYRLIQTFTYFLRSLAGALCYLFVDR